MCEMSSIVFAPPLVASPFFDKNKKSYVNMDPRYSHSVDEECKMYVVPQILGMCWPLLIIRLYNNYSI